MNYDLRIFDNLDELSEHFAQLLIKDVNSARDKFSFVLSGGSTPKYIFKYLSTNYRTKIQWNKINFFWGDERCVPPNNNASNFKMAFENLLSNINIPEGNIFRIQGEADPIEEAKRYSEVIKKNVKYYKKIPRFDLIMLGLGEDGHTASIFPDQLQLINDDKIYSVSSHPVTGQQRITLTGRIINNARIIVFIVTGRSKSEIVAEIINNKIESKKYPANFIKPLNGKLIWLLDLGASILLKGD